MEDVVFSPKQYKALLGLLAKIRKDLLLIKFKSGKEGVFIDSLELSELLHVTLKTLTRWRQTNRLPYLQINSKVFYSVDVLVDKCIIKPADVGRCETSQPQISDAGDEFYEMRCKLCPLFILLNM